MLEPLPRDVSGGQQSDHHGVIEHLTALAPSGAFLDRLVHNAHRLQLAGESMRKQNARANALDGVSNA